ncbi:MAG: hypothetical protein Q8J68_12375 [Methanolobus sp.]|uniref:hypothetical protein n=1 Tax=Methanolobus sp. TaxID=1874737 RepID=UPI00272FB6E0|nr:hypothetical protein [Methanolobus sp.]MDP2218069.1 hypothetical protein [Methanolobus sp.]
MKIREKMEQWLCEILVMDISDEEMEKFVRHVQFDNMWHGVVSCNSNPNRYYGLPSIHDTYGMKWGGRMHIDMGYPGVHIMLGRHAAPYFINYIKELRKQNNLG